MMMRAIKDLSSHGAFSYINEILVKHNLRSTPKTCTFEELEQQELNLYYTVLPNAWNIKEKQYHFSCYSIRAAQMCIAHVKTLQTCTILTQELKELNIQKQKVESFLNSVYEVALMWMKEMKRKISIGYKFANPYSPFLIFLIEICARLRRLFQKARGTSEPEVPWERKFQVLALICLMNCFERSSPRNSVQLQFAVCILKKLAFNPVTKMDQVAEFLTRPGSADINSVTVQFLRSEVLKVITRLMLTDCHPQIATNMRKFLSKENIEEIRELCDIQYKEPRRSKSLFRRISLL